ncbi:MAG TPA: ATP-binding protein [Polyangiaceae bacterium]|nr:ATP-binding protein [Polyangiaceae bacterium]
MAELDFELLFEESPDLLLVLLPDSPRFTMVAATRARFQATHTTREQTIGRGLFELFPDNPDDLQASGTANLRASLERVLQTREADTMAVQKYDIRGADGSFEVKFWSPRNLPVLSAGGEVLYILHRVEDVTELVRASELGEELRDRTHQMEREVIARSRELAQANLDLREANAKLGELDAAKTAFFSNVSHEFRTPLTLMLGPLEESLTDRLEPLGQRQQQRISLVQENALRLLKLVNALLDFSRLEAGRMQACYAPLDTAAFTAELAGMFQSAASTGGVALEIECPPLSEPLWVDRDMWEKIVPNLLSNAFKFTFQGSIRVHLSEHDSHVTLEVADTGVGIPEAALPRIFERFHRVAETASRTHEGTGIGLSLVRELVELHAGRISVTSSVGVGTTFRIELPKGFAHLPPEAVSQVPVDPRLGRDVTAYAAEAARWARASSTTPSSNRTAATATPRGAGRARILIADDNADLREYIARLLAPDYEVSTVPDGLAALEALHENLPDLVVSDVMMPRLDGFALVRELRANPKTASMPVILLSARAGEESSVEGLDTGADDYLVKPFSARELLARVRTHVELALARRAWILKIEHANRELDAFSYSVSHDLRAPLRAIEGFSQALAEDYAASLDARGHDYVERICRNVQRMTTLIDALLDLARITRGDLRTETVDLSNIAAAVIGDLQSTRPERKVELRIAPGLVARGDGSLLQIVLVNLIGNAWKFTSRTDDARIELAQHQADQPTFFVRDNGAGFDMQRANRLFAPFQRFHASSQFEGTGIGLATVQRIINRHGGRIWAESAVGSGTTFYFTLPSSHAPAHPKG